MAKRKSIKKRFIVSFSAFVFVSCAVISFLSLMSIKDLVSKFVRMQAVPVVEKTAYMIDGDEFERVAQELDDTDEWAEETRIKMLSIAQTSGCSYLFTMVPAGGSNYKYVIDGSCEPSDEENFSPMGSEEDISDWGKAPVDAFTKGETTCSNLEYQPEWGWQVSAYAPVRNSRGNVVGIVGCDFNVEDIIAEMNVRIIVISCATLAFVILGGLLVNFFSGTIFGALHKVSEAMYQISRGSADLTQRIDEQDSLEVGSLVLNCNLVIQRLSDLVEKLQKESGVLKETSDGLAVRMEAHIQNINYASDGISEIDSRVFNQNTKVQSVADSVERFNTQIENLNSKILAQSEAIEQSSSAIEQISTNIQAVSKTVSRITGEYSNLAAQSSEGNRLQQEVSDQIEKIAKQSENLNEANDAISSIAEQTNLLAMNAAIEAAHAGELGKGFSVVADEIRALAETSATQSNAISDLLEGITEAIQGIVTSSQQSSKAFEVVGSKITEMNGLMTEIQHGMDEENAGVNNILDKVKILDGTTSAITEAANTMKTESVKVSEEVIELKAIADETRERSTDVANNMLEINIGAQDASKASQKNQSAANHIVAMITGFKVK